MASIVYGDNQTTLNFDGNFFLAALQSAAHRRFDSGKGFFLTLAGTDSEGEPVRIAHWISPSSPLMFVYDELDVHGEQVDTEVVKDEDVDALLEAMDRAIGVIWGFSKESDTYIPFMSAESAAEAREHEE